MISFQAQQPPLTIGTRDDLLMRFQLLQPPPRPSHTPVGLKPAAVLIPIVVRDSGLQLLLTKRSSILRHYPGQICFPGGHQDCCDPSAMHTALRETHEEIGLPAELIEIIGHLNLVITTSQFCVTPVVGLITKAYTLTLRLGEVEEAFEVPLNHLLNRAHHIPFRRTAMNQLHTLYGIRWQQHIIWGATANMIRQLVTHLTV